ncbi:spore coat protein GerQ [Desertibacillus haloalkaliphilus]|nr:spore coat protein GerQ [Desertibacillus haloalkaliphilus]
MMPQQPFPGGFQPGMPQQPFPGGFQPGMPQEPFPGGLQPGMPQQPFPGGFQPGMPQQPFPGGFQPGLQVPPMPPAPSPGFPDVPGMLPMEQSYIENILRLNRGKIVRVHMTFENNPEWTSRVFVGRLEEAGRDHIVISDPETGRWYLLLMVYLDFVSFDEEIEYEYPFDGFAPGELSQYQPR